MNVSVYITSYNQKEYLTEAIESVLVQTWPASQIIIVDDCSWDGSQDLIAGYASRYPDRIRPVFHATNQGVAQARTSALEVVTGDYVTYVDGDDRILPTKLERETECLRENPEAQIVYSNVYQMAADGQRIGTWVGKEKPPQGYVFCQTFARDFPRGILFRNELVHYAAWKPLGFYDRNLRLYEDYDMRIRLTKQLRVAYVDEPLSEYRKHEASLRHATAFEKLAAFDYICAKNASLLNDLHASQRRYIERKLDRWKAYLIRTLAKEKLGVWKDESGHRGQALQLYRQSLKYHRCLDYDLVLGLLLPRRLHMSLRGAARGWRERLSSHGKSPG